MDVIEHGRTHYKGKLIFRCRCGCLFSCEESEIRRDKISQWCTKLYVTCPECSDEVCVFPNECDITHHQYSEDKVKGIVNDAFGY